MTAVDAYGNAVTSFTDTVTLSSTDAIANVQPSTYTYTSSDGGTHAFSVTLNTAGSDTLMARDGQLAGSQSVLIQDAILVINGNGTLSRLTNAGLATSPTGGYSSPSTFSQGVAVDASGNIFVGDYDKQQLLEFSKTGNLISTSSITGAGRPEAVAVDGLGQVWTANYAGSVQTGSVSEFTNAGLALSPSGGYTISAPNGSSAGPMGIAIDLSGNVWVTDSENASVIELLGAAAPVAPLATGVTTATTGTRP